jgi:integrase
VLDSIDKVDVLTFDRFKQLRIKQGVSPAGVNRDLALPRAAFNFAVKRRILLHSPLDGVKLFNEGKHRKPPRTISFAEERKIQMCCDVRLGTIVDTLLDTGMRIGIEALRLKWADVDFEESTITVVQSKTAAGLRVLPMTTLVKYELQKWRTITNGISEYVFFNPQQPSTHIRCVKTAWTMLSSWQVFPDFLSTSVAQASQPDLLRQVFQIQSLTNCSGTPVETSFASTPQESRNIFATR